MNIGQLLQYTVYAIIGGAVVIALAQDYKLLYIYLVIFGTILAGLIIWEIDL